MTDILVIAILFICVGCAVAYMSKAKKSGVKCIGCPSGGICSGHKDEGMCSCGCHGTEKSEPAKFETEK